MTRSLILVGGGEHAAVVAEMAEASGDFSVLGYTDPIESGVLAQRITYLGGDDALSDYPEAASIITVGATGLPTNRQRVASAVGDLDFATVIDATAVVAPSAEIGVGVVVMAGAVVQTEARIGDHCLVNTGSVIEHNVTLGDHVIVAPAAVIGGGSQIGAGSFVGLGALVRDHVRVGGESLIGMGAAVVGDAPPSSRLIGIPARQAP